MSKADASHPDIPEQSWTNPFPEGHPMCDLYGRRVRNEQDLVIIIDDYHSRRGTGKTAASLQLGEGMDQNGGLTREKVSLQPELLRGMYSDHPKRSALLLDEGELGASNRDAMTKTNKALREIMSIGRVEEKYVIVNTPDIGFIDKDIRKLADVWMTMLTKGVGLIHYIKRNPYARGGNGKILTPKEGIIQFRDVQAGTRLRDVYNDLTREKQEHIDGESGGGFIPEAEHREELKKAKQETRKSTRDEILANVYDRLSGLDERDMSRINKANGVSQAMLGDAVDLTQQAVGNIVRGR